MISSSSEIANILKLEQTKLVSNDEIHYLSIDSRNIYFHEKTLFIAIEGSKVSGSDYIEELIDKGVKNFLVSKKYIDKFSDKKGNFFYVEDTISSIQCIVSKKRRELELNVIGITGSNGKTIVKEWLNQILINQFNIVKSPKSYNSQLGVPLSVWGLDNTKTLGIFEAGISKLDEMENLEKIIYPTIGIFTHLGDAHQVGFGSVEEKLKEKLKLFIHSKILIVSEKLVSKYKNIFSDLIEKNSHLKLVTWSENLNSTIRISSKEKNKLDIQYQEKKFTIDIQSQDESYLENISTCIATMIAINADIENMNESIKNLNSIAMRLELVEGLNGNTLINDTYNADMDSLKVATDYLFHQFSNAEKTIILSEFAESDDLLISEMIQLVTSRKISNLILIGSKFSHQLEKIKKLNTITLYHFETTDDYIKYFSHYSLRNNIILIKGSRKFQLENIVKLFRKKTHSTYLKVHLNAIRNNLNTFSKLVNPKTKIMIMLKAQGYGLGSIEMAKFLESEKTDYFAVAYTDEGIELRNAGIQKPIMVLNPEVDALDKLIDYNLEPEIYGLKMMKDLVDFINSKSEFKDIVIPIHLKLETGMHRLGIDENDIDEVLRIILSNPSILVKSIMSHLSASDDEKLRAFTELQFERFNRLTKKIELKLGYEPIKHILNSGGIIHHSNYQYDMVRLGIGLYGYDSSEKIQSKLENTISLITKIAQIKTLHPGESTGYSRSGLVDKETKIAIVNLGYADGYHRSLGNGNTSVYIKNQYAPTIGNICMDMTMIDLTAIDNVVEGDEVEMIGDHISVLELAKKSKTISYEILTGISERVQRVYWED